MICVIYVAKGEQFVKVFDFDIGVKNFSFALVYFLGGTGRA